MFNVFWMDDDLAKNKIFANTEMSRALSFMEILRSRQRSGENIHFVVMSSENPHSIGHPGVDVTGPDYDWKKRRV